MSRPSKLDAAAVRTALATHLTIAAAAKALKVNERTLRRWLADHPGLAIARRASLKRATKNLRPGDTT